VKIEQMMLENRHQFSFQMPDQLFDDLVRMGHLINLDGYVFLNQYQVPTDLMFCRRKNKEIIFINLSFYICEKKALGVNSYESLKRILLQKLNIDYETKKTSFLLLPVDKFSG
jgi:hypothetical protein